MSILVIIGIIIVGLCIYGYKQEGGGTEAYGLAKTHWTSKLAFWLFILLVVNLFTGYAIIPNDISLSITK
jgi:hypothetical protein